MKDRELRKKYDALQEMVGRDWVLARKELARLDQRITEENALLHRMAANQRERLNAQLECINILTDSGHKLVGAVEMMSLRIDMLEAKVGALTVRKTAKKEKK